MINNFFVLIKISFLKVDSASFMVSVTGVELRTDSSWILNAQLATLVHYGGKQYDHQAQEINVLFLKNLLRNGSVRSCWWKMTCCIRGRTKCCL